MDMDPLLPKAVWGFNGTERPGAVYLAAVLAAHAQKGVPAFGIYGRDVQDADDSSIPDDVGAKILAFARAGVAAATMNGTSYLAMGGVSMGIGGSIVDPGFLERYLGMRYEMVDMTEFVRRIEEGIYDTAELARAQEWAARYCRRGADPNPAEQRLSDARHAADWDYCLKMALIGRDLMVGNPRPGRGRIRRGSAGVTTPWPPASRGNVSGPTTSPTGISSRPCSIPRSTGTAFASPT